MKSNVNNEVNDLSVILFYCTSSLIGEFQSSTVNCPCIPFHCGGQSHIASQGGQL